MARQDNSFKLSKGLINLTSGVRGYGAKGKDLIYLCIDAGRLTLTYRDGSTVDVDLTPGMAFSFEWGSNSKNQGVDTVEIKSGKFHIGD